jgi:hypothetical protein
MYLMVITEKFIQEIDSLVGNKTLILRIDEAVPVLLRESTKNIVVLRIKLNFILVEIIKQVFCSKHFGNLDELIRVAVSVEEWLFSENHGSKHSAQRPHIQRVIVLLEVNQ